MLCSMEGGWKAGIRSNQQRHKIRQSFFPPLPPPPLSHLPPLSLPLPNITFSVIHCHLHSAIHYHLHSAIYCHLHNAIYCYFFPPLSSPPPHPSPPLPHRCLSSSSQRRGVNWWTKALRSFLSQIPGLTKHVFTPGRARLKRNLSSNAERCVGFESCARIASRPRRLWELCRYRRRVKIAAPE